MKRKKRAVPEGEVRVKLPREGEMFGIAEEILGASHMKVLCQDGKMRMCRIIGKMRRRFWIRQGDVVIIKVWTFTTKDEKADLVWRFTNTQSQKLQRLGHLEWLSKNKEKDIVF